MKINVFSFLIPSCQRPSLSIQDGFRFGLEKKGAWVWFQCFEGSSSSLVVSFHSATEGDKHRRHGYSKGDRMKTPSEVETEKEKHDPKVWLWVFFLTAWFMCERQNEILFMTRNFWQKCVLFQLLQLLFPFSLPSNLPFSHYSCHVLRSQVENCLPLLCSCSSIFFV